VGSTSEGQRIAQEIGYPVIVKAAMGGGGRGMRVVHDPAQLDALLEEAQGEARSAFAMHPSSWKSTCLGRGIWKFKFLPTTTATCCTCMSVTVRCSDDIKKVVEVAPLRIFRRHPTRTLRRGGAACTQGELSQCRDGRVSLRRRFAAVVFHRSQSRIQVEHTVTEMVTGIDLVRSQILIAQGHKLHEPPLALPTQESVPLNGTALQCRVTTEDPEKNFAPDYGKISTYRSPAGFGIRLDGGTAYAGAMLAAYYDSLLVKVTAWGTSLPEACQRMDRALREFRIRGVKTNIPFVENVVNHPKFRAGEVTTSFLTSLRNFSASRAAATAPPSFSPISATSSSTAIPS